MALRRKKKQKQPPYWVRSSEETCPRCLQTYAYGVGVRCTTCDQDLCGLCATFVIQEVFCVGCEPKRRGV